MAEEASPAEPIVAVDATPVVVDATWGGGPTRAKAEPIDAPEEHKLAAAYEEEVHNAKLALIEKRAAEKEKMMDRLAAKKAAQAAKAKERLEAEGATAAVEALEAATALEAEQQALKREAIREELSVEKELAETAAAARVEAEEKYAASLNGAADQASKLAAQHEEDMEKMKQEMADKKKEQRAALQARLAEKKAAAKAKQDEMLTDASAEAAAAATAVVAVADSAEAESEEALVAALTAAGASPEAAAEIASAQATTEREAVTESQEMDKQFAAEIDAIMKKAQAKFDAEIKKLAQMHGKSRDHDGNVVDKKTGVHADGRTHVYVNGVELDSGDSLRGKATGTGLVFKGTGGLRDQRIARAQGRADTKRERAARNAQKELYKAQGAFQRAAGSVIGSVTLAKMPKFMWEFDEIKVSDEECKCIMQYADTNHNGELDAGEIPAAIQIWKQIQNSADLLEEHAAPLAEGGSFGREGLAEAMMQLNGGMTVTEEEVNAMMDDAALDEDGNINKDDLYGLLIRWYLSYPVEELEAGSGCCGGRQKTAVKQR